jgi:catechol 2,3-dioxygenase-like lactoylglutathione lyase family enzyme
MLHDGKVSTTIAVTDLERAKEFYGTTLGLSLLDEGPAGVTYGSGGGTTVFVYPSQSAGTNKATYASWSVNDVASVVADLKSRGVTFEHYEGMPDTTLEGDVHVMGDHKAAWFTDLDGNILAIDSNS